MNRLKINQNIVIGYGRVLEEVIFHHQDFVALDQLTISKKGANRL